MPEGLNVVQHPVLDDRLAILRDAATPHGAFRQALSEASAILAVESTRDLPTVEHTIDTPLEPAPGRRLEAEITIVPVLRAGLGMVDGFLRLLAGARVGHLGMQRDEDTLEPTGYYERLPPGMGEAYVFLLDPMLATGGSAVAALARLKANGARQLRLICLVAAPEGVDGGARGASRRLDLDRGARPPARRERLHPTRPRGCRRPRLRHDGLRRRSPTRGVTVADYLARLGLEATGPPSADALAELQASHLERVVFENLEIQRGRPTTVDDAESAERIVKRGRGGYCFHLNGAFGLLLEALGYDVTRRRGTVQPLDDGAPSPAQPPRRARARPADRRAPGGDVVGGGRPGRRSHRAAGAERGRGEDDLYTLRHRALARLRGRLAPAAGGGRALGHRRRRHARRRAAAEVAAAHERLSTSPESRFVRTATVQRRHAGGLDVLRARELSHVERAGTRTTLLADEGEWFAALADVFDLELPDVDAAERRALWERVSAQHDAWAAERDG